MTLPLHDGSNKSQNVSRKTKDKNNLGLVLSQKWEHCTHHAEGNSLNYNSEESSHVVVDHEILSQRNEFIGTCKELTSYQSNCLPSPMKKTKLTTGSISYKEDRKAASLT